MLSSRLFGPAALLHWKHNNKVEESSYFLMKRILINLLLPAITCGLMLSALAQTSRGGDVAFTSIRVSAADSISLTLTGAVLTSYTILATTDLDKSFTPIGLVRTDENGAASYTDLGTLALNPRRFYRAQATVP